MGQTAGKPRSESSRFSFPDRLPSTAEREKLCRRFELTVGRPVPLIIVWMPLTIGAGRNDIRVVSGLPHSLRGQMLYLRDSPSSLVGIPRAGVIDIYRRWQ